MKCPHCNADLPDGSESCSACKAQLVQEAPPPVPPKKSKVGLVVTLSIVGAVVVTLGILTALLLPSALKNAREKAIRTSCTCNLRIIGLASLQYAMDYSDRYPTELRKFRDYCYIDDPSVFLCPSTGKQPGSSSGFVTDYVYLGTGVMEGNDFDFDLPIAMDDPRNHDCYVNILFKDSHVQGFTLPRKMNSCVEVLHHLFPNLDQLRGGRLILENAKKADRKAGRW